ncbi:MAG: hypothetical protein ACRCZD_14510 [Phycicoccus sp.]
MAALSAAQVRAILDEGALGRDNAFDILVALGRLSCLAERENARELLLRLLHQRDQLPDPLVPLLESLIREHGLFHYLTDHDSLCLADRLALEAHRADGPLGAELVFHTGQSLVYDHLVNGENVVLSAATSFGKSPVVDAYLDASGFGNAVLMVTTSMEVDRTRRRLRCLTGQGRYELITHSSQARGPRNLLILTPERLLGFGALPPIEFFAVDGFHLLDPSHCGWAHSDRTRCNQLNIAFDRLRATGAQYCLIGPRITALDRVSERALRARFVTTGYTTVVADIDRHHADHDAVADLVAGECERAGPGTIVLCRSPEHTSEVARWLLDRGVAPRSGGPSGTEVASAADWVARAYHPDWVVTRALRAGVSIQHGRLPGGLGGHLTRLFEEGRIPYLLVGGALVEGVDIAARTIVLLHHTLAGKHDDHFTSANVRVPSGRRFDHHVGRVVVVNPEPTLADLTVEIPVLSQSRRAGVEVLLHLSHDRLTEESRDRLAPYLRQEDLSVTTLRANRGVEPAAQLAPPGRSAQSRTATAQHWTGPAPLRASTRPTFSEKCCSTWSVGPMSSRPRADSPAGSISCAAIAATSMPWSRTEPRGARSSIEPSTTTCASSRTTPGPRCRSPSPPSRPSDETCWAPAPRSVRPARSPTSSRTSSDRRTPWPSRSSACRSRSWPR